VLELEPDGRIVSRIGGPADSRIAREGRWVVEPGNRMFLRIAWLGTRQAASIQVIRCSKELLQLVVTGGSIE
jgi:hypothetical protein